MFDSHLKSTGRDYTTIVALLGGAFIFFSAAMFAVLLPGYLSVPLALVCTTICVIFSWVIWKKSPQRLIPSAVIPSGEAK
jgi:hypothetical protein